MHVLSIIHIPSNNYVNITILKYLKYYPQYTAIASTAQYRYYCTYHAQYCAVLRECCGNIPL